MLIVGREIGQSVIIGSDIKVTVLQMGSKPSLTIDAPNLTRVSRVNIVKTKWGSLTKTIEKSERPC